MNKIELGRHLLKQKRMGYPNFKNKIVNMLVKDFNVDLKVAKKTVFGSKIEKMIDTDIVWSQHMGPEFWAKEIINNGLLHKNK